MDVVNFISNESNASLLSKLLMKPYQLKMTSHLKTSNKDLLHQAESLSMEKAIEMLEKKSCDNVDAS